MGHGGMCDPPPPKIEVGVTLCPSIDLLSIISKLFSIPYPRDAVKLLRLLFVHFAQQQLSEPTNQEGIKHVPLKELGPTRLLDERRKNKSVCFSTDSSHVLTVFKLFKVLY